MTIKEKNNYSGKQVFVTGVCGTVGKQIISILAQIDDIKILGIDNNESELFFLNEDFKAYDNIHFFYCDIRDSKELLRIAKSSNFIIHTAALKHVNICEYSPYDAVKTNVLGTQSIIDLAERIKCERVLLTSTDKAVNPTNVMGTSKLLAERLFSSANHRNSGKNPFYISTRFGNVLGSRGSVIPIFKKQIKAGGPVALTDELMTRFIMTLEEATKLVLESLFVGFGGEVFVTKMPVIRIKHLAECMVEILAPRYGFNPIDIKIKLIGSRPGEKIYEELTNDEEIRRSIELENYICILPATKNHTEQELRSKYKKIVSMKINNPYNSSVENPLSKKELRDYLLKQNLLLDDI